MTASLLLSLHIHILFLRLERQEAFQKVLDALPLQSEDGQPRPEVVLFEDSVKNLMMAKELGMRTILIGE